MSQGAGGVQLDKQLPATQKVLFGQSSLVAHAATHAPSVPSLGLAQIPFPQISSDLQRIPGAQVVPGAHVPSPGPHGTQQTPEVHSTSTEQAAPSAPGLLASGAKSSRVSVYSPESCVRNVAAYTPTHPQRLRKNFEVAERPQPHADEFMGRVAPQHKEHWTGLLSTVDASAIARNAVRDVMTRVVLQEDVNNYFAGMQWLKIHLHLFPWPAAGL